MSEKYAAYSEDKVKQIIQRATANNVILDRISEKLNPLSNETLTSVETKELVLGVYKLVRTSMQNYKKIYLLSISTHAIY